MAHKSAIRREVNAPNELNLSALSWLQLIQMVIDIR